MGPPVELVMIGPELWKWKWFAGLAFHFAMVHVTGNQEQLQLVGTKRIRGMTQSLIKK